MSPKTTRIHVDPRMIIQNCKAQRDDPVIIVLSLENPNAPIRCHGVTIKGPSKVVYNRRHPNEDGAQCWVETDSEVEIHLDPRNNDPKNP